MRKLCAVHLVVSLLVLAASAFAAPGKPTKPLAPTVSGKIVSVVEDGGALKSFVLKHAHKNVTITVAADTKYKIGKTAATAADLKAGQKVLVRLTAKLANDAGTAVSVRVKLDAPKAK